jgi:hypothetical protein
MFVTEILQREEARYAIVHSCLHSDGLASTFTSIKVIPNLQKQTCLLKKLNGFINLKQIFSILKMKKVPFHLNSQCSIRRSKYQEIDIKMMVYWSEQLNNISIGL